MVRLKSCFGSCVMAAFLFVPFYRLQFCTVARPASRTCCAFMCLLPRRTPQEIARVAKKFRRLAERHGLESMIAASNRLRAHLHALVSRGVQDGLFFRNRAVHGSTAAAAVPTGFYRGPVSQLHDHPSIPYPRQQSEPWNSREGAAWRASSRAGGAVGFRRYGGGPAGVPVRRGGDSGGGSYGQPHPPLPFSGLNMGGGSRPRQRSVRPRGWRWGQGDGDGGGIEGGAGAGGSNRGGRESDAGSVRGEDDARTSDDGKRPTSNHSGSVDGGSPSREGGARQDGKGKGRWQGNAPESTSAAAIEESPDAVSARRSPSSSSVQAPGPGSKGHKRRSSGRRRSSKTEPWVLDLSNSGREDEQQQRRAAGGGSGAEISSPQPGYGGGARRGRAAAEEGGFFRWHGGENRMFRPLQREEGGRFSDGRHPSNVSEDGSWEGTVDWWPRPRSPPPVGAGDAYYTPGPGDYDSGKPGGMFMNPFPGPQGASSLLPAVPTFEESGTRVSWADYRGHSLAEVGLVIESICGYQ